MVYYSMMDSILGTIFIAATPRGMCRIFFGANEVKFCAQLAKETSDDVQRDDAKLAGAKKELEAYLSGRKQTLDFPLDLSLIKSPFQRKVLEAARKIPFGQAVTYSNLARKIGKAKAFRAVGNALGKNPIPIVIPCHRVVASDGSLAGYTGGLEIKKKLLQIERSTAMAKKAAR